MLPEIQLLPERLAFATQDGTCLNASPKEWERGQGTQIHVDESS